MPSQWKRVSCSTIFILGTALLACPGAMLAQHGGGGGHGGLGGGGGLSGGGRPSGVDAKDDLKDFHHAMAVQATPDQSTAYAALIASTQAASHALHELAGHPAHSDKSNDLAQQIASVDQALKKARDENRKFLDSFSKPQKSGLKDITKRLEKADSELADQARALPTNTTDSSPDDKQIASIATNLDKALTNFSDLQLSLGREMGIELPSASEETTLEIPAISSSVSAAGQPIAITTSGKISKLMTADGGQSQFKLEMVADLSDLQQNVTTFLRAQLDKGDRCGERIGIRRATFSPSVPSSFVTVQLHFERWTCGRVPGQQSTNEIELVEGDGSIAIKLTGAVDKDGALQLKPEVTHTEGNGAVGEMIRSGSLGDSLRENITQALLSAIQKGIDMKRTLPAAGQGHATIKDAKFRDAGAGNLNIVVDGEMQISNEQFDLIAGQLKERVAARGTAPH